MEMERTLGDATPPIPPTGDEPSARDSWLLCEQKEWNDPLGLMVHAGEQMTGEGGWWFRRFCGGSSWGMETRTAPGCTGQRSGVTTTLLLTAGPQAELAPAHTPGRLAVDTIRPNEGTD